MDKKMILRCLNNQNRKSRPRKRSAFGADEGNRTPDCGLGSRRFTIKLHPHISRTAPLRLPAFLFLTSHHILYNAAASFATSRCMRECFLSFLDFMVLLSLSFFPLLFFLSKGFLKSGYSLKRHKLLRAQFDWHRCPDFLILHSCALLSACFSPYLLIHRVDSCL